MVLNLSSEIHRRQRKRSKKPSHSTSSEELANNTKVQVREQVAFQPNNIAASTTEPLPEGFEANLYQLLAVEMAYHPRTDYLFNNAVCEDKVDAGMRDEAIFNLRFLHKFHGLAPECFAHAVNMTDRFLARVKVKPKYMACLATAAYLIAVKMIENRENWPAADKLVRMARCGGSPSDLQRMEAIIRAKLRPGAAAASSATATVTDASTTASEGAVGASAGSLESAVTPLHFLILLRQLFVSEATFQRAVCLLETCLCSVSMYSYRPAQLALCVARRYLGENWEVSVVLDRVALILGLTSCCPADQPQCEAAVEASAVSGLRSRVSSRRGRLFHVLQSSVSGSSPARSTVRWPGLGRLQYRRMYMQQQQQQQQLGTICEEQQQQQQKHQLVEEDSPLPDICQLFGHEL